MIYLTFVARLSDGMPLVATFSHSVQDEHKRQAKEIMRGLNTRYVRTLIKDIQKPTALINNFIWLIW